MKILLAEDEAQLNRVLTVAMQKSGYEVDSVFNGQEAVDAVKKHPYDVIIMDIMMPVKNGLDAVKEIRATGDKTYIMMLTAKSEIDDKVTGLDVGADDYLTKPFSLKELLARLRSKERRSEDYNSTQELNYDNLKLDLNSQELSSNNSIRLSKQETGLSATSCSILARPSARKSCSIMFGRMKMKAKTRFGYTSPSSGPSWPQSGQMSRFPARRAASSALRGPDHD